MKSTRIAITWFTLTAVVTLAAWLTSVPARADADNQDQAKIRRGLQIAPVPLCFTPYFTDAILAALGGLVNPLGLFYVIASALPSTLGANAGLLGLPGMMRGWKHSEEGPGPITRSVAWISTAAVASLLFIFVLGRGITWSR